LPNTANTRNELTKFTFEHSQIEQLPRKIKKSKAEITVLFCLLLLLLLFVGQRSRFHFVIGICCCCCCWRCCLYRYCWAATTNSSRNSNVFGAALVFLPPTRSLSLSFPLSGDALGVRSEAVFLHFVCGRRAFAVPGKHHILQRKGIGSLFGHGLRVYNTVFSLISAAFRHPVALQKNYR